MSATGYDNDAGYDSGLDDQLRASRLTIRLIAIAMGLFVLWAAFAWVDEIVRADGEVVSSSRSQSVQNLEGGILADLAVKQGDLVEAGQVLATLSDTRFRSAFDDLQDQIDALELRRLRLEAEIEGKFEFNVPEELATRAPRILSSEQALLAARQTDIDSRREGAFTQLEQAQEELSNMENLYKKEFVALLEVNKAREKASEAEIRYMDILTQAELVLAEEYSETLKEITSLRQEMRLAQDQLSRTVITAPMRGIVNNLAVTTIGGVVRPGEEIFEIIPLGEELFVEARVRPENIANVEPGQDASIKLTAYDYTIYGTLKGKVDFISADTFEDERDPSAPPFYRVTVNVNADALTERQKAIEIRPGMRATVELHTGSKTILRYLLKPLYKSKEAFREP
ncbi:HlyD family type I secretion periplasmic adaptor subunit [Shimia sp. R9_1]|uniref:HlyD family type I secretion periplasmic adaptor subunit n=1 Tax=unclassified Shimia TaxID=2630038 RepID=UPI001ADB70C7|nr:MULTISPECIES: HlyD family type I secretion periplasmic adaptor subunit [unclassified Shimia]MBO9401767.1 HlyD family type I secretion periplasmic adaptor subunit [Shimia sp. R9_3]MBO9408015.1 HlyD family type I secretion periplasmic adaptor subunit [Shimia sp. R9_1]